MAYILPSKKHIGKTMTLLTTSATAFVKGKAVKYASGYATNGAAGDNRVDYISLETKTSASGDGSDTIQVIRIDPSISFYAVCSTTPVQATHVGNRYDLATGADNIDLAATTDQIFTIDRIVDATNKIVEGRFVTIA